MRVSSSGQIAHISMRDFDGLNKVKSYNLSTGSLILQKNFIDTSYSVIPDDIFLYNSSYTVCTQTNNINFTIFYTNGTYIGRYTIN